MTPGNDKQVTDTLIDIYISIGVGVQYLNKGVEILQEATESLNKIKPGIESSIPPIPADKVERPG